MARNPNRKSDAEKATDIVRDSGGTVVGRTRLQKIAYLLEITGTGEGFRFEYRNFGPYSDSLASAALTANLLNLLEEEENPASWGGFYSTYRSSGNSKSQQSDIRKKLAAIAVKADPVQLELAATAAFLAAANEPDPWEETARRKPEKATQGRIQMAKVLYEQLRQVDTPISLPEIL